MNDNPQITFGADPEFFFVSRKTDTLVPSWTLGITGTKGNPQPIDWLSGGCGVLNDGVAIELNLLPHQQMSMIHKRVSSFSQNAYRYFGLGPKDEAYVNISNKETIKVPKEFQEHDLFKTIGCDPDYDAYKVVDGNLETGKRPAKSASELGMWRHAGGHIHFGCNPWPESLPKEIFVRLLDLVYFAEYQEAFSLKSKRNVHYGMPGIFRPKEYGVEYRTPNTSWVWHYGQVTSIESAAKQILLDASREDNFVLSQLQKMYEMGMLDSASELWKEGNQKKFMQEVIGNYDVLAGILYHNRPCSSTVIDMGSLDIEPVDLPQEILDDGAEPAADAPRERQLDDFLRAAERLEIPRPRGGMNLNEWIQMDAPIAPVAVRGPRMPDDNEVIQAVEALRGRPQIGAWWLGGGGRVTIAPDNVNDAEGLPRVFDVEGVAEDGQLVRVNRLVL